MDDIQKNDKRTENFYSDAANYWSKVPATEDGMLGGFGFISNTDIEGSELFLRSAFKLKNPPRKEYALDCGSGIGRISKHLLTKHFKKVDLVEQNSEFLEAAKTYLAGRTKRVGEFFPIGLQNFCPEVGKYDVIWCQWVLGHLQDDDFIKFFSHCQAGLKENGVVIVKENITSSENVEVDTQDSSVTRPLKELQRLFDLAGFSSVKEQKQSRLPRGLYPVYMFILRPRKIIRNSVSNVLQ
ncbi:N-terminal Xaa-Pro-Lys N-methyltransferase 1 [Neodiprion pinetum]|uniref:N-terminal Xaa-Pro-Lys N-methyltransferase 1 n=1 Tax=Neodiprion pinetum TaxID=441929 RepID=UPI001EE13BE8|nr:N-terminal Xaa-Pro-Lys N-methyltransferase 1 [Neodiprion pinetum]